MGQVIGKICCSESTIEKLNPIEEKKEINSKKSSLNTIKRLKSSGFTDEVKKLSESSQYHQQGIGNTTSGNLWKKCDSDMPCSPATSLIERMTTDHKICEKDFNFHHVIGIGGFSRVYLAYRKGDEEENQSCPFAIKTISKLRFKDEMWDQFLTELKILSIVSSRNNPFLTKLYCSFQSDFNLFFCLEYVPGGSLRCYLDAQGTFDLETSKFVAAQVLLGLTFLHEKLDIIHRDLKPENVLIDANGHCKLTDFGLSKIGKMKAFSFCGTFKYIAPELIKKQGYNKMVDFWMLGCLVYEMLVGKSPFTHKNKKTMFDMINAGCYKVNLVKDPDAKDLIGKLLVTNPNSRLGSQSLKEVTRHPFFKNINFKQLMKSELVSPLKPYVVIRNPDENVINDPNNLSSSLDMPDSQSAPQMHLDKFSWVKLRKLPSDIDTDFLDI